MKAQFCARLFAFCFFLGLLFFVVFTSQASRTYLIDASAPAVVPLSYFNPAPSGGDTIKILSSRTQCLKFNDLTGSPGQPIVIINSGGQVDISSSTIWGALSFVNCRYIKVSGRGSADHHFGFRLSAVSCGLAFADYSSDCEAENIEIHHTSFFGIFAKKDFGGSPPVPYPVFSNLIIHDMYIHHVEEGMYIGETKSPGMEFRHVRIYNNVVTHCLREAIQVANCVEDIEVYNNFCAFTGLGGLYAQSNVFQIGGNTIGRYYNNIFMHAPENGVICMGSGDIEVFSNYISDNDGIYIDNREFNIAHSSINFNGNFIRNTLGNEVILNANQLNDIHILDNAYNTNLTFARASKPYPIVWDTAGNYRISLDSLKYTIVDGLYVPDSNNPASYMGLGPIEGLSHQMNGTPVIDSIGALIVSFGDTLNLNIHASAPDGDFLSFQMIDLPGFAEFTNTGNGEATLHFISDGINKGVYYPTLCVYDSSNRQFDRETFRIAIRDTANHNPTLSIPASVSMEAASKHLLQITATDADLDPIAYSFTGLPDFVTFINNTQGASLDIKPLLADTGTFIVNIIADDGYGVPATAMLTLRVNDIAIQPNRVLYRVNCSGPELEDQPINWQFDNGIDPVYGSSFSYGTGSHSWNGSNQTGAPNNLFGPFRHYGPSPKTMAWFYPVPSYGIYRVRLFFAERSTEVNNNTTGTFHVKIEDSLVLNAFNIYNQNGFAACKREFDINVTDNGINILFTPLMNDAKVNGFEIILLEPANNPPQLQGIENIVLQENEELVIPVVIKDDDFDGCDSLQLTLLNAPGFVGIAGLGQLTVQPDYEDAGIYNNIRLIVTDGCLTDTISFNIEVLNVFINTPPVLNPIQAVSLQEAQSASRAVSATDFDNQSLTYSYTTLPGFVVFQQGSNGNGTFLINPGYQDAGNYQVIVTITDTYGATDSDTLFIEVINTPEIQRIILNTSMITDLVRPPYGSSVSPNYLVDEQSLNPVLNQHPVSQSWKPYHNLSFAPYHVYFDLGQEYVIRKVYFHDMHNVANLEVAYGTPSAWTYWFTEPCNAFTTWKLHEVNATTRYIRLSMTGSVYAAVNEIALYGYPASMKKTVVNPVEQQLSANVFPIPCDQFLTVQAGSEQITALIYGMNGQLIQKSEGKIVPTSLLNPGTYILMAKDESGTILVHKKIMIVH